MDFTCYLHRMWGLFTEPVEMSLDAAEDVFSTRPRLVGVVSQKVQVLQRHLNFSYEFTKEIKKVHSKHIIMITCFRAKPRSSVDEISIRPTCLQFLLLFFFEYSITQLQLPRSHSMNETIKWTLN